MDIRTSGLADRGGGSHLQEEGPEGVLSIIIFIGVFSHIYPNPKCLLSKLMSTQCPHLFKILLYLKETAVQCFC